MKAAPLLYQHEAAPDFAKLPRCYSLQHLSSHLAGKLSLENLIPV